MRGAEDKVTERQRKLGNQTSLSSKWIEDKGSRRHRVAMLAFLVELSRRILSSLYI